MVWRKEGIRLMWGFKEKRDQTLVIIRLSDDLGIENPSAMLQAEPPAVQDREGKRVQESPASRMEEPQARQHRRGG